MSSNRNLTFFCLLITALFLSAWSAFIIYYKKSSIPTDLGKPDAFMEEIVATIIDKQGNLSLKIVSPKMVHYLENDTTEITKPLLILYRNRNSRQKTTKPWYLSADHAKASQGISQIHLWENVIIHHPGDEQNEKTTLLAPTLTVYPEKQLAETPDPVIINQPNTKIHAVGMNANLDSGAVKLLSQTRGEYRVPN